MLLLSLLRSERKAHSREKERRHTEETADAAATEM